MSHLTPLISDLALILICAGITTLIFKKLKQPLVLGYIVAGFLCSPHFQFTPSVADEVNMQIWSEIGVIFLLFALGLDFSFKKMLKSGSSTVIAACTIIFCMILIGMFVGWLFGWKQMDCMFLGGMLAMSSTTIIYKAFDDMGLRQQRFAGIVLSILVLEDILAIVLMVMLTTLAVSKNFEGGEMAYSIVKLVFFLVLWFVVGIYLIPLFLRRVRRLMSNETLLIVSLALCFGMVVLAAKVGFSPAFGAFVMGSILSETIDSERIEHLVNPVKDLFGAIFFVSVGMMVDPAMIVEYIGPIIVIVLAILVGQTVFGTGGVLLSGQPLKIAVQCGFSLSGCRFGHHHFLHSLYDTAFRSCLSPGGRSSAPVLERASPPLFRRNQHRKPSEQLEEAADGYSSYRIGLFGLVCGCYGLVVQSVPSPACFRLGRLLGKGGGGCRDNRAGGSVFAGHDHEEEPLHRVQGIVG